MLVQPVNWISRPAPALSGTIAIPGDKSISHRALILASIAEGQTKLHGFLAADDCIATLRALKSMGVNIQLLSATEVIIDGVGKYGLSQPSQVIDCGNSGTSLRLLAGLLVAQAFESELTGDASLLTRPMQRVCHPLTLMGGNILSRKDFAPLSIKPSNKLTGIHYSMPTASAQVKSSLLLAGMYAKGETSVMEPARTRDHTERLLQTFQYPIQINNNSVTVGSDGVCLGAKIDIPSDLSSAAFFIVAATLIPGSEITLLNIGINPTRCGILDILRLMGASIELSHERWFCNEPVADIHVRHARLKGIDIPLEWVPCSMDELPIIMVAASMAKGSTVLRNANELRCKESDRIRAMENGLRALGVDITAFEDGVRIQGGELLGGHVNSFGDHRIAMAFAVAGACSKKPVTIVDCSSVSTSFPNFLDTAKQVNFSTEILL